MLGNGPSLGSRGLGWEISAGVIRGEERERVYEKYVKNEINKKTKYNGKINAKNKPNRVHRVLPR
jgi:hypothetical protein